MQGRTVSLSEHLLASLASEVDRETAEGRAALLARSAPLVRQISGAALRMQMVRQLADMTRLEPREVDRYLAIDPPERGRKAGERTAPGADRERAAPQAGGHSDRPDGSSGESSRGYGDRAGAVYGPRGSRVEADPAGARSRGRPRDRTPYGASRPSLRVPVAAPDLDARMRLLLAFHPALVDRLPADPEWLAEPQRLWLGMIRSLPPGSTFASVCERLRSVDGRAAEQLEREGALDAGSISILSEEEASAELNGAILQLEQRWVRQSLEQLVNAGIRSDDDRARYHALLSRSRQSRV
jgi:hypothetical protein